MRRILIRKAGIMGFLLLLGSYNLLACAKPKPPQEEVPSSEAVVQSQGEKEVFESEVRGKITREELQAEKIGTGTLGKGIRIKSLPPIYFEFDKYTLTGEAQERLRLNAEWLKKYSNIKILIEGHCDEWGTNEYNLALGNQRAQTTRDYLVYLGIEKDRLDIISYGEEHPADPGHNREAWKKNRRAEFVVIGD